MQEKFEEEMSGYAVHWAGGRSMSGETVYKRTMGTGPDDCPLEHFWHGKRAVWPILSFLASIILAIPASSADVERLFSRAGCTMSERRTSLNSVRFHKLMVLQGNSSRDLYKKFPRESVESEEQRLATNKKISEAVKATFQQKKKRKSAGKKKT